MIPRPRWPSGGAAKHHDRVNPEPRFNATVTSLLVCPCGAPGVRSNRPDGGGVTRLGIGLAPLIGQSGPVDERTADDIVRAAFEAGLRYIDVAPLYGLGRGEAALRRLSEQVDGPSIAISTKAGRLLRPRTIRNRVLVRAQEVRYARDRRAVLASYGAVVSGRAVGARKPSSAAHPGSAESADVVAIQDFTPAGIQRSARESLSRLGRETVDIMFLHDPDGLGRTALAAAWRPLQDLRASGVVRAIGISSNEPGSLTAMLEQVDADIVLLAGRYTLLDQSAGRDLLPLAERRSVSVVLGGVFNGGILADPLGNPIYDYRPASPARQATASRIMAVGRRHGVPIAAAAMQFAAAHPAVTSVLVGVRSIQEMVDDLAMARLPIPAGYWTALKAEGLLPRDAIAPEAGAVPEFRTG